jgi:hypothetical protein
VLALVVALAAALLLVVRAPVRKTGWYALRGHRVFGVGRGAVRGIEVAFGERRFVARRTEQGWEIDGSAAGRGVAEALDGLLETLVHLRAVDVFRNRDTSAFGLARPRATIDLVTARGARRLVIGETNLAGSALYARRVGDPRVLQVGTLLLSDLERVFYFRDGPMQDP